MDTVSILIVEDHDVFSGALLNLLGKEEELRIAAVVKSAEEGLEKLKEIRPDLILVDVGLPGMDGISMVKLIHDQYPNLPCLMISAYLSSEYLKRSLQAGARGYLIKDDPHSILEGIRSIINGRIYISKELGDLNLDFLPGMGF